MFRRFGYGLVMGVTGGAVKAGRCLAASRRAASDSLAVPIDVLADDAATKYDYDLVVIGGGSGGLACAKRAADLGAKVVLCDFVRESSQGSTWGLGGTCVNVGCIPKKLMHAAALQGELMAHHVNHFGWYVDGTSLNGDGIYDPPKMKCDWSILRQNVDDYIRSLNFGYRSALNNRGVKYLNAQAKFVDPHTIECTEKKGKVHRFTARRILLATGGRPEIPNIPGAKEYAVTSDDIFRQEKDPGKTCVVGASYVALECAGFLHGIGREAQIMMRSIPLRGFDTGMANKVVEYMEKVGIKFHKQCVPVAVEKREDGRFDVTYEAVETKEKKTETFDTVLFATGRKPETHLMNLEQVGVKLAKSGHVLVDKYERTSVPHIYAIGDIRKGGLELTPVAIKAGIMLADRLYNKSTEALEYAKVPTTVFTPLEYGCVGLSEDEAIARCPTGPDGIEVFHTHTSPLEWNIPHLDPSSCYVKVIVNKASDEVLGFHILAPNAGEITQGVAIALRKGITKADLDATIGIHPTLAEDIVGLKISKSSGEDAKKQGC